MIQEEIIEGRDDAQGRANAGGGNYKFEGSRRRGDSEVGHYRREG